MKRILPPHTMAATIARRLSLVIVAVLFGVLAVRSASAVTNGALTVDIPGSSGLDSRLDFSNDADHTIQGTMTNNSNQTLRISFARTQRLPKAWTTSICFGASCYAAQVDSADDTFTPGETRDFIMHVNARMSDHPDSGWVFVRIRAEDGVAGDTVSYLFHTVFTPGQPPVIFQLVKADTTASFAGNGPFLVNATYQNRAADSYKFGFHLDSKLPTGWVSSMCIRDSCGTTDIQYPMASLVSQIVRMRLENPSGVSLTAPDSAVFYLTVRAIGTGNAADSMQYRFVAQLQPKSSVSASDTKPADTRLLLGSIWPNPATSDDIAFSLRVNHASECSIVLYDPAGHVVLQESLGSIPAGTSTISLTDRAISLRNVRPGAYFVRISNGVEISNPVLLRIAK